MEVHTIVQDTVIKTITRKRNAKGNWLSKEALQAAEKKR